MCHQVIEKTLKSYFVAAKGNNPPHTHNLSFLANKSGIYDSMKEEQKDLLDLLEPLNVEARYPTHKERLLRSLNETRCKGIVQKTEGLYEWIKLQSSNV